MQHVERVCRCTGVTPLVYLRCCHSQVISTGSHMFEESVGKLGYAAPHIGLPSNSCRSGERLRVAGVHVWMRVRSTSL